MELNIIHLNICKFLINYATKLFITWQFNENKKILVYVHCNGNGYKCVSWSHRARVEHTSGDSGGGGGGGEGGGDGGQSILDTPA